MNVLGISAFYHDSAAALVCDGKIIAAAQEERFTRVKFDADFPAQSIAYCLQEAGLRGQDIDYVAFYEKPFIKFERLIETYLAFAPSGFTSFRTSMPEWISHKLFQKKTLLKELRCLDPSLADPAKLLFSEHHVSHAASAFYPSPFAEAAVLTMDGVGEWTTTSIGVGRNATLEILQEITFPHSLGLLYSAFTYYLGFKPNADEYKVMGLAPYGTPVHAQTILDSLIDVKPDGSFRLAMEYFDYCTGLTMVNDKFEQLFGAPTRRPQDALTTWHADIAASVQSVTELVVLRLTRAAARQTGMINLCLAGGVALNCVANAKIVADAAFQNVWVQPAAGDAGGALGAALAVFHAKGGVRRIDAAGADQMAGASLGPAFSVEQVRSCLDRHGAVYQHCAEDALLDRTADALAAGKVVGWFQGRMEFGPRALGNRSILADARDPHMQRSLNLRTKYRESFRPFAPAVPVEDAAAYFDLDRPSPYMLLTAQVRTDRRLPAPHQPGGLSDMRDTRRSDIPAVTHVDYSARVQTVAKETNGRFHQLLRRFQARTGSSVLVNTSFNVRDEPIVCSPDDAYRCFMMTEMDVLVIGDLVLEKSDQARQAEAVQAGPLIPPAIAATLRLPDAGWTVKGPARESRPGQSVPSLLPASMPQSPSDPITLEVREFYEKNPFPNYDGIQDYADIVMQGQRSAFSRKLLSSVGMNKLILECGCGTGQLSHFLSLNNNHVLGIDLSLSSLQLALDFKLQHNLQRTAFVQMDIFDLAIRDETFDVVISSGVLHHTKDARRAFAAVAGKLKPGGAIVVGLYNRYARLPTLARSKLLGALGSRIDPIVRKRIHDPRKAEIWVNDQYYHPHETWHSADEVLAWFAENNITFTSCYPPITGTQQADNFFDPGTPGTKAKRLLSQLAWLGSIGAEGGLFVMMGRKGT